MVPQEKKGSKVRKEKYYKGDQVMTTGESDMSCHGASLNLKKEKRRVKGENGGKKINRTEKKEDGGDRKRCPLGDEGKKKGRPRKRLELTKKEGIGRGKRKFPRGKKKRGKKTKRYPKKRW